MSAAVWPSRAAARSIRGMVASPHAGASSAGLDVLRRGGTAVDAAVAANALLAVVYPASCGLGGDALWMVYEPRTRETLCYNGSGAAARRLHARDLRAQGHRAMPTRGALTVTVPGAVRSWETLVAAHGRIDLDELLAPAEAAARDGFVVTDVLAEYVSRNSILLSADAEAERTFLSRGAPRAGDVIRIPALAETLRTIRRSGADGFYVGAVAEAIVRTLNAHGNPMQLEDLADNATERVAPVGLAWHDITVLAHPPNSQGALALMALGMLASDGERNPPSWYHLAIEALKRAFDERDQLFGDPRTMAVSIDDVLKPQALAAMRARIDEAAARRRSAATTPGGTVGIVAVDAEGRAVSLLQSLFMGFGSGLVAAGTGIFLQNRGACFSLEPGPNELVGGKRPLHTLSPGMAVRNGSPELVYATMGGDGQVQTHVQLLHDVYECGMDLQRAIDYPRFVYGRDSESAFRDIVRIESRMPATVLGGLAERGHTVVTVGPYDHALGHAQGIAIDADRGTLAGGADPRADSAALGL